MADTNLTLPSKKLLFTMLAGLEASHDWALIAYGDLLERGDRIIDTKGQGNQDYYDLMVDSDAVLAGLIETRIGAVAGLDQRVDAASDDPRDLEIAEFVSYTLAKMGDFEEKLANILSACRTGFSVMEIMWGEITFDGKERLVPVDLIPRRPERFRFDIYYKLHLLTTSDRLIGEEVPEGKFLVHSFKPRYNNPYGTSICRIVWWYWWFKHHAYKWWLQAAERGAVVSPVLHYPEHANEDEIAAIEKAAKLFAGNKFLVLREGAVADFPHIKIDPNFCKNLVESCDMQMRAGILGSTLSSGTAESGTRALGVVHDKRFQERIEADAKELMATINEQLIPWMVLLNYPEPEKFPVWSLNYEQPKDLKEMRLNIEAGVKMGIPIAVQWAAETMQIEVAKEGEDLLTAPPAQGMGGGGFPIPPDDDEEEPEEPEEEEPEEEVEAKRDGIREASRMAVEARGDEYQKNAERLTKEAAEKGFPIYREWGTQAKNWIGSKATLEDALQTLPYFEIDIADFVEYLGEAHYLSLLRGFSDPFDMAVDRGLRRAKQEGLYSKLKKRVQSVLFGAEDDDDLWAPVPFDEATEHFQRKLPMDRAFFDDLEGQSKRKGLTAAGMSSETVKKRLRPVLLNAIRAGHTFEWVYKKIDDVVVSKGHAENIFRTNIQTSYNSGHAEAIWSPELADIIPAFRFDAILDERTTDICRERSGKTYPREFLESSDVVPPLHYMCRSSIIEVWADEWDGRTTAPPSIPAEGSFGVWKSSFPPRLPLEKKFVPVSETLQEAFPGFDEETLMDFKVMRAKTLSTNKEHSAIFDRQSGERFGAFVEGQAGTVSFQTGFVPKSAAEVVMVHTHPENTTFSPHDISQFLSGVEGAPIWAVLANDAVYIAARYKGALNLNYKEQLALRRRMKTELVDKIDYYTSEQLFKQFMEDEVIAESIRLNPETGEKMFYFYKMSWSELEEGDLRAPILDILLDLEPLESP